MVVLWESSHFGGGFAGVVAQDFFDEEGIGDAVGDVVESSEFVCHGVADAEEGIGERHTGHCRGVCHFFASFDIGLTVVVGAWQVFEDDFEGLNGEPIGVVGRHNRGVGFERVCDGIDTRGGGQTARCAHVEIGIDDGHIGEEFVVGQGIFNARVFVGDDGKRRDFGARTSRCRNGDEIGFFAHFWECIDALANIHKAHGHVLEIDFGVFVHDPHDLCGVHGGTTAQSDDDIGLERDHLLRSLDGATERRIGRDVEEARMCNAHFV